MSKSHVFVGHNTSLPLRETFKVAQEKPSVFVEHNGHGLFNICPSSSAFGQNRLGSVASAAGRYEQQHHQQQKEHPQQQQQEQEQPQQAAAAASNSNMAHMKVFLRGLREASRGLREGYG